MILYLDASALAKRYVDEPGGDAVARILAGHVVATSRMSEVEVASALARRFREGTLARRDMERALAALHADLRSIALVEMVAEVVEIAVSLLGRHPLRAGDSLQLASCLYLRRQLTEELMLLAYDERLNTAARAERLPLASTA